MREANKRANAGVGHHVADHTKGQIQDPKAEKLLKSAKGLGNEEIQKRIAGGNTTRDEMLAFIAARLGTLREAQMREMAVLDHRNEWYKKVADTHKEAYTKPNPKQWGEPAKVYEEAARELCRGALDRGKQLMERALNVEQKQLGDLTRVVDDTNLEKDAEMPEVAGDIVPNQGCGATDVPAEITKLAQEIQNVNTEVEDVHVRRRIADPWWTLEEEEEEEGEGGAAT